MVHRFGDEDPAADHFRPRRQRPNYDGFAEMPGSSQSFAVNLQKPRDDAGSGLTLHAILRDAAYVLRGPRPNERRWSTQLGSMTHEEITTLLRPLLRNQQRTRDTQGKLPLHAAAGKGAPIQVLEMLEFRGAYRVPDYTGALPLHHYTWWCSRCKAATVPLQSKDVIQYLVERGGGVDTVRKRDRYGRLPLHNLFLKEREEDDSGFKSHGGPTLEVVKTLVDAYAASLGVRTSTGDLPLTMTGASASLDVIYHLLRREPEVISVYQ